MDVFEAIADPVRRSILQHLNSAPSSAGNVAARFAISRPAVSRHLRVLREAGLVSARSYGREQIYQIEPALLTQVDTWLQQFNSPLSGMLDALETEVYRTRRERRSREAHEHSAKEQSA